MKLWNEKSVGEEKCDELRNSEASKLSPEKEDKSYLTRGLVDERVEMGRRLLEVKMRKLLTPCLLDLIVSEGHPESKDANSMTKELLDTNKCYLLDCGLEIYAWMGKKTSLDERKKCKSSCRGGMAGGWRRKDSSFRP
ncbi:hypothetical protein POM88_034566 [Heracleum sosnowskyi]|uniref:Gelsolin-like domain-containing protein n=1 Tax=Heracleum sosnowskyi TaxID=360622 RepID=A0AAD8HLG4_9APIA|nr:hypothetical protein POM88_034566 [Heracleum sosnowskyi]